MPKVSFDSQDKGDRCLELALAVRLSRVSRRKKDDFAHSGNCKIQFWFFYDQHSRLEFPNGDYQHSVWESNTIVHVFRLVGGLFGNHAILNRVLFRDGPSWDAFLSYILPEECILRRFNYCCVEFILLSLSEVE